MRKIREATLIILVMILCLPVTFDVFAKADGYLTMDLMPGPVLVEDPNAGIALNESMFHISDEDWAAWGLEPIEADELINGIQNIELMSLSPNKESALFALNQTVLFTYRNGTIHLLHPNYSRGIKETYEVLQSMFSYRKVLGTEKRNTSWSPSGRYCICTDDAAMSLFAGYPPILIDLENGEGFTIDGHSEEGKEAVTTAVFSSDEQFLYYAVAKYNEYQSAIKRYNILTGEVETCLESYEALLLPTMIEYDQNHLLIHTSPWQNGYSIVKIDGVTYENRTGDSITNSDAMTHLVLLSKDDEGWKEEYHYSAEVPYSIFKARECEFSRALGYFYTYGRYNLLRRVNIYSGETSYWHLEKEEDGEYKFHMFSEEELLNNPKYYNGIVYTFRMKVSPEGKYAIIQRSNEERIYLVNLSSMELIKLYGPKEMHESNADYRRIVDWNNENIVFNNINGDEKYTTYKLIVPWGNE